MNKCDVVIPYGRGSTWQENELKYSLRSVEMYLKNYRNVFVIGEKPKFISDRVIHIPHRDLFTNAARNIMTKVHRACRDERVSDNFMVLNDDYFFLKEVSAPNYPYWYKSDLNHTLSVNQGEYKYHAKATLEALINRGLPIFNFDCHWPIVYDKKKYMKVVESYNWELKHGLISRSLYCNTLGIVGAYRMDCKISGSYQTKQLIELNKNREMFSVADRALNSYMKKYIMELYPNKSCYER